MENTNQLELQCKELSDTVSVLREQSNNDEKTEISVNESCLAFCPLAMEIRGQVCRLDVLKHQIESTLANLAL